MITAIEIKKFRGITESKIDNLKDINVFIGRNNHGKSSILEALYLASAVFRYDDPLNRGSKIDYLLNRRSRRNLSWNRGKDTLWYRYNIADPIEIVIRWEKGRKLQFDLVEWHMHPMISIPYKMRSINAFKNYREQLNTPIHYVCWEESALVAQNTSLALGKSAVIRVMEQALTSRITKIHAFLSKVNIIDANLIYEMERVEKTLWNDLLKDRLDKVITEILKTGYEVDVEDLTYMPLGDIYQLAVKLPATTTRVDDLGDGARYSMILLMVASLAHRTALLVEEPENHQHPGGLAKSWEMLVKLSQRNDIQLFITTHSLEFIRLLGKIASEQGRQLSTFFIEMDKEGKIEPRLITPTDSENLHKMGLDERFLDIL
jgi:hypothetical protein